MKLPPHTSVAPGAINEILTRHGLTSGTVERLPDIGIINAIYRIGESMCCAYRETIRHT